MKLQLVRKMTSLVIVVTAIAGSIAQANYEVDITYSELGNPQITANSDLNPNLACGALQSSGCNLNSKVVYTNVGFPFKKRINSNDKLTFMQKYALLLNSILISAPLLFAAYFIYPKQTQKKL